MDALDELLTIAEISVGIAGFSGVIAAFLQRDGLPPLDRVRFINLFSVVFTTLTLAFAPIALHHLGIQTDRLWMYSSSVMVFAWFINVVVGVRYVIPAIKEHLGAGYGGPMNAITIPSALNLLVQLLNLSGWLWEPGFPAYLFGLFVYLYASGVMFVFVVLYRPNEYSAD